MPGIAIVDVEELVVYKVVGSEWSVEEYAEARAPEVESDWSGVYLQYSEVHAMGTIGYRWDQGYEIARMAQVVLGELKVIVLKDSFFSDGTVSGEEKAMVVRGMLESQCGISIPTSTPLVTALGDHGFCLTCEETPGEWEFIISPTLLMQSTVSQSISSEYKPKHGATAYWREDPDAPWMPFNEADRLELETPNPQWLATLLKN
eukprot:TRINITY_DN8515_c0_g1_i2.p1 TRINITY_DN8515_c0_g1~~TRINITY_DN8515_c0_g1_i2.p1  ORF type:complete len:204 (+),score=39.28 TRINITY_DN8515_c0_g1_i2:36-647(+)